ncbi:MAG: PH domain-containing protein [Bacilli bacterium]|nr:PH domain-containing protein [Bacilli bacterium]
MGKVYKQALRFKDKYPGTVAWRLKQNAEIVERHLNPDEEPLYTFVAQKNDNVFDIVSTAVVCLTNKRILIGRKRVIIGYFLDSITPDMFNDLKIKSGIIWGKIYIDTIKEFVTLSNISIDALPEIETSITSYMMEAKKLYPSFDDK